MTRAEFETMTFDEVVERLNEENNEIHSFDSMMEFVKHLIDEENIGFALHILNAVYYDEGAGDEWWRYDYSMGTLETPTSISEKADVEDLIEAEAV